MGRKLTLAEGEIVDAGPFRLKFKGFEYKKSIKRAVFDVDAADGAKVFFKHYLASASEGDGERRRDPPTHVRLLTDWPSPD